MEPTDDWRQLELLCVWEEQRGYESIRALVLFGDPVTERAAENRDLGDDPLPQDRGLREGRHGSLFGWGPAKRRILHRCAA